MNLRAIRRQCEARLAALTLPTPFDAVTFCADLAAQRGRPIILRAMPLYGTAYGFWLRDRFADYILFEQDTSPFHQRHIILHEISHMLCGHEAVDINAPAAPDGPFAGLDLERLQLIMQRATYSVTEECEAELLATLIEKQASTPVIYQITPLADRLAASLEGHIAQVGPERGG